MSGLNALLKCPQQVRFSLTTDKINHVCIIEQGESTDNGSNLPTPAVVEVKRRRKTKTMTKVVEGKPDEPMVTSASPKTMSTPPAGLLPHPHNRGMVMCSV